MLPEPDGDYFFKLIISLTHPPDSERAMEQVKEVFDAIASDYDAQRRGIVPEFEDFYQNAVRGADWQGTDPAILDIGAGTGLLSALILEKYPYASLCLMDISDNMLKVARDRFAGRTGVKFRAIDYRQADLGGPYDIVCSALSIHHLEHDEKRSLYKRIFAALNPGGIFVNAEQVEGETEDEHRRNMAYWEDFIRSGPLPESIAREAISRRDTLDRVGKASLQLAWLRESGFSSVDIVYKNRMLVVMRGWKR
jgi:tRNA (cmo5U34)-methyltransferase